jgi:putative redox protein
MITSKTSYLGSLRTVNTHVRSGSKIITDAPLDNKGKGEAFSPTDLVATALCDCMLTIMGIAAEERGFSINGASGEITKIMSSTGSRKIQEIVINLDLSMCELTDSQRKLLTAIPSSCPVALSIHPEIKQNVSIKF